MCYPEAYIEYLVQFHVVRDYFECHEILEDYWKDHPDSPYRETWVMLIQLAVSLYHQRRGNLRGAVKLMRGAIRRYDAEQMRQLGVDGESLQAMMEERLNVLLNDPNRPYVDLNVPICDGELLVRCHEAALQIGGRWGQASDLSDVYLLNRHKLRDRAAEKSEREAALKKRQASRSE